MLALPRADRPPRRGPGGDRRGIARLTGATRGTGLPSLAALRNGGKAEVARALAAIETAAGSAALSELLDAAAAAPRGRVLGLTGPPGVGKSTLTHALVQRTRRAGATVAVIAVDPSSRATGGALLGDRTRVRTDPDDAGSFVRSMAARDRLGGLSDHAVAAIVLLRALYDRVIVETVGVGQSESDVSHVADTVVLLVQPGSGDALQFMKAGIMELPDVIAVTKADAGAAARRARADVEGALGLARSGDGWTAPVLLLSAATGEGLDALEAALDAHAAWLAEGGRLVARRRAQARHWVADAIRVGYGTAGLAAAASLPALATAAEQPFQTVAAVTAALAARLARD